MTKRIFALISVLLILFSFAACKKNKTKDIEVINGGSVSESGESDKSNQGSSDIVLDPFKGLDITVTGISPFCQISINTSECDPEVQEKVKFSADKDRYANGEKATITASLGYANGGYTLASETKQFDISNMPEYITSVEGLNLDSLKKERDDFVTAQCAEAIGDSDLMGTLVLDSSGWGFDITEVTGRTPVSTYIVSLKANKRSLFPDSAHDKVYNKICFLYRFSCKGNSDGTGNLYVSVCAENVVKYPNGTLKWGTSSADALDFKPYASRNSLEEVIASNITSWSDSYDIKEIKN